MQSKGLSRLLQHRSSKAPIRCPGVSDSELEAQFACQAGPEPYPSSVRLECSGCFPLGPEAPGVLQCLRLPALKSSGVGSWRPDEGWESDSLPRCDGGAIRTHPVPRVASRSLGGAQARETTCRPLGMPSACHALGMACVWRQGAAC